MVSMKVSVSMTMCGNGLSNPATVALVGSPDDWLSIGGPLAKVVSVSVSMMIVIKMSKDMGSSSIAMLSNKSTVAILKSPDGGFGIGGSLADSGTGSSNI